MPRPVPSLPWLSRLLLCAGAAMLPGCASGNRVQQLTDTTTIPPRVAVLPPAGGDLPDELATELRIAIGNALEQRGYVKFDDGWVDQRLTRAGFTPWRADWLPVDEHLSAFGVVNGIDALVFLENFDAANVTSVLYNERSLTGRIRVLDARRGRSTWIFDVGSSDSGGVLLQSGQVFDAFTDTAYGAGQRAFAMLAARLALTMALDLPPSTDRLPIEKRPRVDRVQARPAAAGANVEVTVEGTPGCRAFASVPRLLGRYPLSERQDGVYVGTLAVPTAADRVVAILRDRVGASSVPVEGAVQQTVAGGAR